MMKISRICGGCTACCKTHAIAELQKPEGTVCSHCTVGTGCRIYASRPKSCRTFQCAWLMGFGLSEYRPDMTGIVPDFQQTAKFGLVLCLWETNEDALSTAFAIRQTRLNFELGKPVLHVPILGTPKFYLPRGKRRSDGSIILDGTKVKLVEVVEFVEGRF